MSVHWNVFQQTFEAVRYETQKKKIKNSTLSIPEITSKLYGWHGRASSSRTRSMSPKQCCSFDGIPTTVYVRSTIVDSTPTYRARMGVPATLYTRAENILTAVIFQFFICNFRNAYFFISNRSSTNLGLFCVCNVLFYETYNNVFLITLKRKHI